jgi:hypothetical protein
MIEAANTSETPVKRRTKRTGSEGTSTTIWVSSLTREQLAKISKLSGLPRSSVVEYLVISRSVAEIAQEIKQVGFKPRRPGRPVKFRVP